MKINEFEKGGVTQQQLDALEKVLDQVFSKVGIDIEFTRHFIDRVNDERNVKPISIKELAMLFKKEFIKYGKPIAQLGPDAQAVMKDLETDINIPFVLNWNGKELELVAKTVMRKKNFKTPNPEFPVEAAYPAQQISRYNPDGETYRGTTNRIPNSKSVSKKDITVKRKKAEFPDGATDDTTFNDFSKKELKQTTLDVISELGKREQLILKARFGLEPFNKSYTIQQVASAMELSPERIRQIEARALRLLKHPSRSRKLRSYMDESGLPPHLAKHFDKDGDAVKGSWKDGKWTADKKQPKKVKYTVKDVTPKGYGPLEEDFGSVPPLPELIIMAVAAKTSVDILKGMFKTAIATGKGLKKLNNLRKKAASIGQGMADYAMPESLDEAPFSNYKEDDSDNYQVVKQKGKYALLKSKKEKDYYLIVKQWGQGYKIELEGYPIEDGEQWEWGSVSGRGYWSMYSSSPEEGFDNALSEAAIAESTKDELMSKLKDRQKKAFYDAALTALDRLVKAKGTKQSVGGYAFDIARAFAGIDAKELVNMYNQINEWGLARKQRVAKQSDPLTVLDTLSTRNDNAEFPIKFYDDEIIKVTPTQARRFMNAYLKMEPEKRDIIDKYIKSKRGFRQAIQTLDIREDAFDLLSAALDWDK